MEKKILIIAGEPSGDLHGAYLVKSIKKIIPEAIFFGLGGYLMKKAGVEITQDTTKESTIGFIEAIKILPKVLKIYKELKELTLERNPDLLILIDYPEFNLFFAKFAKKANIPVVYYMPPTIWAWREKRAKKIAKRVDEVISILPFEKQIYDKYRVRSTYIGHPLIDIVKIGAKTEEIYKRLGIDNEAKLVGLLPGSRKDEVERLLPILVKTAELIKESYPKINFIIPLANNLSFGDIYKIVDRSELKGVGIKIAREENNYEIMDLCELLIVASGTATLEAMILNVPMVVVYKTNWITWLIGKSLVKLKYYSLPNIIAGKEIVPEMFQDKATPELIYREADKLLRDERIVKLQKENMEKAKSCIGDIGVIDRAANIVGNYLK
ncbi:MAG: lipid-A-disaccharide synthase [bacterium]|nr:lipid-A-disaccharide synthase [bacterium]